MQWKISQQGHWIEGFWYEERITFSVERVAWLTTVSATTFATGYVIRAVNSRTTHLFQSLAVFLCLNQPNDGAPYIYFPKWGLSLKKFYRALLSPKKSKSSKYA